MHNFDVAPSDYKETETEGMGLEADDSFYQSRQYEMPPQGNTCFPVRDRCSVGSILVWVPGRVKACGRKPPLFFANFDPTRPICGYPPAGIAASCLGGPLPSPSRSMDVAGCGFGCGNAVCNQPVVPLDDQRNFACLSCCQTNLQWGSLPPLHYPQITLRFLNVYELALPKY